MLGLFVMHLIATIVLLDPTQNIISRLSQVTSLTIKNLRFQMTNTKAAQAKAIQATRMGNQLIPLNQ